jgi:hypothetical protein
VRVVVVIVVDVAVVVLLLLVDGVAVAMLNVDMLIC